MALVFINTKCGKFYRSEEFRSLIISPKIHTRIFQAIRLRFPCAIRQRILSANLPQRAMFYRRGNLPQRASDIARDKILLLGDFLSVRFFFHLLAGQIHLCDRSNALYMYTNFICVCYSIHK